MSLDVYLVTDAPVRKDTSSGIFIRQNGATKEISRSEWDRLHPNDEPVMLEDEPHETTTVYSRNITHNLNTMAEQAGIVGDRMKVWWNL